MVGEQFDPQLVLKTSPPRMSSWLLPRERLALGHLGFKDKPAILVQAPAGFGKTSLLMQWRRSCLANGAVVVWLTVDERDNALRLAQGIGNALSVASSGVAAGKPFLNWLSRCEGGIEALTGLLVEISEQTFDVVVILDNFERGRKGELLDAIAYMIRNAPANLQLVISARTGTTLDLSEIIDSNIVARISSADLAFQYEETLAVIAESFGNKLDSEESGRLHELTEGWPLGLQLVIATLKKSPDLKAATRAISACAGDIQRYFVENLIARLTPEQSDFLTCISIFDLVHPELCAAVFPEIGATNLLTRLCQETPVFLRAENSSWMRMHGLARDFLLARFQSLPPEERRQISMRASEWLSEHAFYEEAAHHALLAGREEAAYKLAERTLYQIGYGGRVPEVLKWIDRLSASELKRYPALWMAAGWSLALSSRHSEAENIVGYILSDPLSDAGQRFEAGLISAVAASFDDQLGRFAELMGPWVGQSAPPANSRNMRAYINAQGFLCLYRCEPGNARHLWMQVAQKRPTDPSDYSSGFAEFGIGLSFLWEGQFHLAEKYLRAALVRCEQDQGRRSPIPCMIAAVLAATLWEMGGVHEPRAILSYRVDVLEKSGLPETIILAYETLARLALHAGQEAHAFEQLSSLIALGEVRKMARLQIAGICEQIRLHAHAQRPETVADLCKRLEVLCSGEDLANDPFGKLWVELHLKRAQSYAALVAREWERALECLGQASQAANAMRLGREGVELRLLRAVALHHCSKEDISGLLEEALSLARAGGMVRTLLDTHPDAVDLLRKISRVADFRVDDLLHAIAEEDKPPKIDSGSLMLHGGAYASALLTSKELKVLSLMANQMSNKQIATALDIAYETVKWHTKNIFGKLNASNRAHAIKRAHILGVIETPFK